MNENFSKKLVLRYPFKASWSLLTNGFPLPPRISICKSEKFKFSSSFQTFSSLVFETIFLVIPKIGIN